MFESDVKFFAKGMSQPFMRSLNAMRDMSRVVTDPEMQFTIYGRYTFKISMTRERHVSLILLVEGREIGHKQFHEYHEATDFFLSL